jgi:hypothetical protein
VSTFIARERHARISQTWRNGSNADNFRPLYSNIPIRWHNAEMIAHEAVIISPPYRPEDCKGSAQKVQVLNQVKKVLEGERRKLSEREKAAGGARKGG